MSTTFVAAGRLARTKTAYTTGRVDWGGVTTLLGGDRTPRSGDLLLARVAEIGQLRQIDRPSGRRATLFVDDEIVLCYGHRHAPDPFEARVPGDLSPCHLIAAGGVAARILADDESRPTAIEPIGLLGDREGRVANLKDFALAPIAGLGTRPLTLTVVGAAAGAGSTDTVAHLVSGLRRGGRRVGVARVAGTGAGDAWLMADAGADPVLDVIAAGYPSTFRTSSAEIEAIFGLLLSHLWAVAVDAIVLEVAGGLYRRETVALLASRRFADCVDGVVFAAGNAPSAVAGVTRLRENGLPVVAMAGRLASTPSAAREAAAAAGLPVLDRGALASPGIAEVFAIPWRLRKPRPAVAWASGPTVGRTRLDAAPGTETTRLLASSLFGGCHALPTAMDRESRVVDFNDRCW